MEYLNSSVVLAPFQTPSFAKTQLVPQGGDPEHSESEEEEEEGREVVKKKRR